MNIKEMIKNNCYILEQHEQTSTNANKKYLVRTLIKDNKESKTIFCYLGKNIAKKLSKSIPTKRKEKIAIALNYHPSQHIPSENNIITFKN